MNSLSHLYVAAHLDEMLSQAAAARLAASGSPERTSRLADAVKSAWSLLTGPAERPTSGPTLTAVSFRG